MSVERGFRLLVVDDHAETREYLARVLQPLGTVESAVDGLEALAAIRRDPPDLVLTDMAMPNMDGIGLVRALRESEPTRTLPVMILSARSVEDERLAGINAGANDYLVKPYSDRELFARVRALIELNAERVRAASALRDSEERFRAMANGAPMLLWMTDARGELEFVNRTYCEFVGADFEDACSGGWPALLHPLDAESYLGAFKEALQKREPFRAQARIRRADGQWRWVESQARPRFATCGEFLGMAGSSPDITERKEVEDVLRESNRRKTKFLAILSHELRNPLAPIKNSLYILGRATPGGEQARRAHAVIDRQVDLLSRLVDDLLDVTRITSNKVQLQLERVDLNELVRRTVEDHRSMFERNDVELQLTVDPTGPFVLADWSRLSQVVANLLHNAAKFAGRGAIASVTVSRDEADGRALITVSDSGVGMATHTVDRLFQPFMQADETLDRSKGGLGIGLTLVKGLVDLHQGEVAAYSEGAGKGSSFVVRLPEDRGPDAQAVRKAEAPRAPGRRVLIIEDNVDAADTLCETLEMVGHQVEVAYNGPDGVEKASRLAPDVVLCDIGLPGMDGYEVARVLRRQATLQRTLLVALSGYALPEDIQRAAEAGFGRHLAKPPDLEQLETLLAKMA